MEREKKGFFHGWMVIIALTLVMAIVYGAQFSFSVFLKPLSEGFGWTRAMTSGALSTSLVVGGLLGILMGALTDKYGPRIIIIIGALLGGSGYLLISQINALWQLYLGFGILIAVSTSVAWTPITATASRWFTEKRVLALGIVTAGITLGQMFVPLMAAYLVAGYDWRTAYIVIAVMVWVIVIPAAMPLRHSPQDMGLLPDGKTAASNGGRTATAEVKQWSYIEALRTLPFWLLTAINVVVAATFFLTGIHIVAHATDLEIAATSAALILTFMGGANILAKFVVGPIASRISSKFALLLFLALEAVALFSFIWVTEFWMLCAVAALFGFGFGGGAPPMAAMVAEFFGVRSVGVIMGLTGVGWAIGCAIGTFLGDYLFDISGSYNLAFLVGGGVAVTGMMLTYLLRAPGGQEMS
jgi:MFS family permease